MSTSSTCNPFHQGRFYHLPILPTKLNEFALWEAISGGLSQKPLSKHEFSRSLQKAKEGYYSRVSFPCNSILHPEYENFVKLVVAADLVPMQQIPSTGLNRLWAEKRDFFENTPIAIELILEDIPSDLELVKEIAQRPAGFHATVPGIKGLPIWQQLDQWPSSYHEKTHFYFPYKAEGGRKNVFTPAQIMALQKEFIKKKRDHLLKPPLGVDLYEDRVDPARELEPNYKPVFQINQVESPKVSVVIPAYNNGHYLLNTLKHLEKQNLDKSKYEVVVVDDGSSDDTSELVLTAKDSFQMALTYIYFPRNAPRKMGDSQFRAGLARNLGVKYASGQLLAFLDSDIITPSHYLQKVIDLHQDWDVVQWRRDYLNKDVPSKEIEYVNVDRKAHCFIPEDGYWHKFYQNADDLGWSNLPDFWKYTCTYGLSLERDVFYNLGWFRKTYCFYGFEDTDLGWRLLNSGARFYFNNEPVYHLYHPTERSEYGNSFFLRQRLLKNTARIFFNNNLSPEIYQVFKMFLREGLFF